MQTRASASGANAKSWLRMLAAVACFFAMPARGMSLTVELDRGVMPTGGTQTAVIKISLTPPELAEPAARPPVNLAVVLDRSGSMQGERIRQARAAALEALRRLDRRDVFSLIGYDSGVETLIPAQPPTNLAGMEEIINSIQAGGMTALFSGVSQGAAELRRYFEGEYVHRIILLSDGIANVGPSTPHELGRLGASLAKENIAVSTVGLGLGFNEDLMTRLAQTSGGNAYFVEASQDLPRIFAQELGDVLNVAARRVVLRVEFVNGARPLRILGREGRIDRREVEIPLNQLYGGLERFVLVEIEMPEVNRPGQRLEVARARCDYEDMIEQRQQTVHGSVSVEFSDDADRVRRSVNHELNRQWALNSIAIVQEEAVEMLDRGEMPAAQYNFRQSAEAVRERGRRLGVNLDREAEQMEAQADRLEQEGYDSRARKQLRTESYQWLYQNR